VKAARELVFSQSTFTLAVVREKDTAAAFQTGVNGILAKPITADQAKNTFLAALNAISGTPSQGEQESPTSAPQDIEPVQAADPALPVASAKLPAETLSNERYVLKDFTLPRKPLLFAGYAQESDSHHLGRRLGWAALAVAGAGIAFGVWKMTPRMESGTVRRIVSSAAKTAEAKQVPDIPKPAINQPPAAAAEHDAVSDAYAFNDYGVKNKPISRAQIRVRPVLPFPQNARIKPAAHPSSYTTVATQTSLTPENPEIPDSLSVPVQTMVAHTSTPKPHATENQWRVGPLELPEEISRHLVVHRVLPIYPAKAIEAGLEGAVVLQAWVGQDGGIRDLKLVRGYLVLGKAAIQAVKQWRYQPYRLNGEIVDMQTFITVDFQKP
jgi:protein TonB